MVMDQLARGLDRKFYEPVVVFDTPQSSMIRKELTCSGIKTIELVACRDMNQSRPARKVDKNRNFGGLLKANFGERVQHMYFALKSAVPFFFREIYRINSYLHIIRKNKIELVHTHSDLRYGKPEIIAARMAGIPCISHHHGYAKYTYFDRLFARFVSANIYISNDVAEYHISGGESRAKGKIIHNGVNLSNFIQQDDGLKVRKEFGFTTDQILVGIVARLDWWKGHEFFLEAMAEVVKKKYDTKGLIIGGLAELNYDSSKRYLDKLHHMVNSLGLEEKIVFLGHRNDVPRLISSLDVVVHASSTPEPFGLTVIEGMAAGKPVVATSAGGVLDIIEDGVNGLLVPCKDSKAMATAILQILSNRDKAKKMGLAARRYVAEKFTVQQQVTSVQKLYDSVPGVD